MPRHHRKDDDQPRIRCPDWFKRYQLNVTLAHEHPCLSRCINASQTVLPTKLAISEHLLVPPVRAAPIQLANGSTAYIGTRVLLGGGLNNMLMNLAQLLHVSCDQNATLLLPRLDSDPLGNRGRVQHLLFSDLFDLAYMRERLFPCKIVEGMPRESGQMSAFAADAIQRAVSIQWMRPQGISSEWNDSEALARVYSALKPNKWLEAVVGNLQQEAQRLVGPRWASVHLPIERDWWWEAGICHRRKDAPLVRRCFSPTEVGHITNASRHRLGITGVLLMYAHDKVSHKGPAVCRSDFGGNAFKLALPPQLGYTERNAAEQYLAARAPAAFYGNSFSTFGRGVALMRRGSLKSHAYDSSALLSPTHSKTAKGLANHPGAHFLHPVNDAGSAGRLKLFASAQIYNPWLVDELTRLKQNLA